MIVLVYLQRARKGRRGGEWCDTLPSRIPNSSPIYYIGHPFLRYVATSQRARLKWENVVSDVFLVHDRAEKESREN